MMLDVHGHFLQFNNRIQHTLNLPPSQLTVFGHYCTSWTIDDTVTPHAETCSNSFIYRQVRNICHWILANLVEVGW